MTKNMHKKALLIIPFALFGAFAGYNLGRALDETGGSGDALETAVLLALIVAAVVFAFLLHVIVHEAGHLVMGLATGYRFRSFRVGTVMLVKDDEGLRLRRFSLAGTGGQCLLGPPVMNEGRIPYILYNLGGVLANALLAALCAIAALALSGIASSLFAIAAAIGVAGALMNGVPLSIGGVDNDGRNIVSASESPEALRAFWIIMKAGEEMACGVRVKDMPASWFEPPSSPAARANPLIASVAVMGCQRLLDEGRIAEARRCIGELLDAETGMLGIHRMQLRNDLVFCELMEGERVQSPEPFDKETQRLAKTMRSSPSVLRTSYARALLVNHDGDEARAVREKFDRIAARYPYPADVESERELMDRVDERTGAAHGPASSAPTS